MISKYSKYVPLNLPDDQSTELFVKAMEYKAKNIESNVSELQAYTDEVANVELVRASDKEYFNNSLNGLLSEVNELSTVDFSNMANVKRAKQAIGSVLSDKRIVNGLKETANYYKTITQWDKVKSTPGLSKNYHSSNYQRDMGRLLDYINSDDPMASSGLQGASLYSGVYEKLDQAGNKFKTSSKDYQLGDFTLMTIKEKNKLGLHSLYSSDSEIDNQLQIELEVRKRNNPNFDKDMVSRINPTISAYKKTLDNVLMQYDLQPGKSPAKPELEGMVSYLSNAVRELESIKELPIEQQSQYMLKNEFTRNFVSKFGSDQDVSTKVDTARLAAAKMGLDNKRFSLDVQKEENDMAIAKRTQDREDLELNLAQLGVSKKGSQKSSSENEFNEPITLDLPTTISDKTFTEQINGSKLNYLNQSKAAIADVIRIFHQLPNYKEKAKQVQDILANKNIKINLDNKNIDNFLLVPSNLSAFSAALDLVASNSGVEIQNPLVTKITQGLSRATNLSTLGVAEGFKIKTAQKAAYNSLGLKNNSNIEDKDAFDKEVERHLQTMQIIHYQDKALPLTGLKEKEDKASIALSSYMRSLLETKKYVEDEKKNAYQLTDEAVVKDGKSLSSSSDLKDKIDFEKSDFIYLDAKNKRMKYAARDSEGKSLGDFYLPLSQREVKQVAELHSPGSYESLVDFNQTEDNLYDSNLDEETQETLSNQVKYLSSAELGLPVNTHIQYRTLSGREGERSFAIKINNKDYNLYGFQSLLHLKQGISSTYKIMEKKFKDKFPEATAAQVKSAALNYTIEELQRNGH